MLLLYKEKIIFNFYILKYKIPSRMKGVKIRWSKFHFSVFLHHYLCTTLFELNYIFLYDENNVKNLLRNIGKMIILNLPNHVCLYAYLFIYVHMHTIVDVPTVCLYAFYIHLLPCNIQKKYLQYWGNYSEMTREYLLLQ